jgi:aerobic-type carbon monoxide dehydrogenase small subunit (CoxS/CutS family)
MMLGYTFTVCSEQITVEAEADESLLWVLRDQSI